MKAQQDISAAFQTQFRLITQTRVVIRLLVRHTSPITEGTRTLFGADGRDLATIGGISMPDTPVTWLDDFSPNQTTTGTQFQPRITQFTNGNILVAWTSAEDTGAGSPPGDDILGRIYDPLGNAITDEFRLNTNYYTDDDRASTSPRSTTAVSSWPSRIPTARCMPRRSSLRNGRPRRRAPQAITPATPLPLRPTPATSCGHRR